MQVAVLALLVVAPPRAYDLPYFFVGGGAAVRTAYNRVMLNFAYG